VQHETFPYFVTIACVHYNAPITSSNNECWKLTHCNLHVWILNLCYLVLCFQALFSHVFYTFIVHHKWIVVNWNFLLCIYCANAMALTKKFKINNVLSYFFNSNRNLDIVCFGDSFKL
jgi:hypothetical protein